jgi:hypothetical protein
LKLEFKKINRIDICGDFWNLNAEEKREILKNSQEVSERKKQSSRLFQEH